MNYLTKLGLLSFGAWMLFFIAFYPHDEPKTLVWKTDISIGDCQRSGGKVEYNGEVWQGYAGCWLPKEN